MTVRAKHGVALVLHAHLPFVLNHGTSVWLHEAAAETCLPLGFP